MGECKHEINTDTKRSGRARGQTSANSRERKQEQERMVRGSEGPREREGEITIRDQIKMGYGFLIWRLEAVAVERKRALCFRASAPVCLCISVSVFVTPCMSASVDVCACASVSVCVCVC